MLPVGLQVSYPKSNVECEIYEQIDLSMVRSGGKEEDRRNAGAGEIQCDTRGNIG
jgi:hypothetical protein